MTEPKETRQVKQSELREIREKLIKKQKGLCKLCGTNLLLLDPKLRCVDHDHKKTGDSAGAIRGALCSNCNSMEGKIYNRVVRAKRKLTHIQWLENLLKYWKYHQTNKTGLVHPKHKVVKKRRAKR